MQLEVKSVLGPIIFPAAIGAESAELAEGVSVGFSPPSANFLDAGLEDVAVAAFDHTGADGQVEGRGAGIVELVGAIPQVAECTGAFLSGTSAGSSRVRRVASTLG